MKDALVSFLFSMFWKYRHLITPGWETGALAKVDYPQTAFIVDQVLGLGPRSVLEFGCGSGSNLIAVRKKSPEVACLGLDISRAAVAAGNKYISEHSLAGVELRAGDHRALSDFPDRSFDVTFAAAVLIYFDPKRAAEVVSELFRLSAKGVVLVEQPAAGAVPEFQGKKWFHPYEGIFRSLPGCAAVRVAKISPEIWPGTWSARGRVFILSR